MKSIQVKSSKGNYPVYVGEQLLSKVGQLIAGVWQRQGRSLKAGRKVLIVTQKNISEKYLARLYGSLNRHGLRTVLHLVPDGEKAKSEKELFRMYRVMLAQEFERGDAVLAFGGGVVGDLSGFCASTYMRGISFINVATTLLAQVDSAIGGKTGINLEEGKNLVGTFYPPDLVISDIRVLKSLPERVFRASLAEVVKYGVIRDASLFRLLESKAEAVLGRKPEVLARIVAACSAIKAQVVSADEREKTGERMILNYGHTFGHAFEQVTRYRRLLHGEAVSIGMVVASRLATQLGCMSAAEDARQRRLLEKLKLPVSLAPLKVSVNAVLTAMLRDKKREAGKLRFILPKKIGQVEIRNGLEQNRLRQILLESGARVS